MKIMKIFRTGKVEKPLSFNKDIRNSIQKSHEICTLWNGCASNDELAVVTLLVLGHCLDCALSSKYPSFDTSRSSCLIQWQWGLLQLNTY